MHIVYFGFISIVCGCNNFRIRNIFSTEPHVAALILARGGSKGVPLKNIQKVAGISLIGRALKELDLVNFESVWVSTDHDLIHEEATKYQVNVHWRAPYTATDEATSIEATQEFLAQHPEIDTIALIQCTSPFIKEAYLHEAINLIKSFECVFSVSKSSKLVWQKRNNGSLVPVNFSIENRPRRQELNEQFVENGMFYYATRKLIESGRFQTEKCATVEIPPYTDMEIDTPTDLIVANMLSQLQL